MCAHCRKETRCSRNSKRPIWHSGMLSSGLDRRDPQINNRYSENLAIVQRLARVRAYGFDDQISAGLAEGTPSRRQFDVAVSLRAQDRRGRRTRQADQGNCEATKKIIANSDRQLNNPGFTAKAPAHIVEGLKKQRDDAQQLLDKLRRDLDALPPRVSDDCEWRADAEVVSNISESLASRRRRPRSPLCTRLTVPQRSDGIRIALRTTNASVSKPKSDSSVLTLPMWRFASISRIRRQLLAQQNSSRRCEFILRQSYPSETRRAASSPRTSCAGSRSYQRGTC